MTILLFPGRHLLQTAFQERYLRAIAQTPLEQLTFLPGPPHHVKTPIDTIVFAITSANHQFTRYNPLPLYFRAIGVDRLTGDLTSHLSANLAVKYRIFGIPHYGPTTHFASIILKEIAEQTEGDLNLTTQNCVVLSSTPAIAAMFHELGFSILPGEASQTPQPLTPQQLIAEIMAKGPGWSDLPELRTQLAPTTFALWQNFPEVPRRVFRLWNDPLLTDEGSLTATRNYSTYAQAMGNDAVIDLKYADIKGYILPGRIADEGCADGALLVRVAKDFPDSDLIGIEITGELLSRCLERQRAGEFGDSFVHFHQRNLTSPIFEPGTVHTTICNSTIHELWSYNQRDSTVMAYLNEKFRQLAPGGHLIIRDVVGPENSEETVYLWLNSADGAAWDAHDADMEVASLSTFGRFFRFAQDFLPHRRQPVQPPQALFTLEAVNGVTYIVTTLRFAAEYISKKDYVVNWASEMHEEFAFWSFSDWKSALGKIGYIVKEPSHVYTNNWIVENRLNDKVALYHRRGDEIIPLPFPPTTVVLVAQKPNKELK